MMIARCSLLFVAALFLSSSVTHAGTFAVFGPRDYVRDAGQARPITETFTTRHGLVPYKLRLVNGGASGTFGKVTSAIVKINGVEIFAPKDFNANMPVTVEKTVTLAATNEISVEVRGAPGDGITITVLGEDSGPPMITAAFDPLPNAAGWHRDNVTVTFTCTDSMTAVVSCSPPVVVTAEGVTQVTATAVDETGNTATRTVPVSIDKTSPTAAITAPRDSSAVHVTSVDVDGTVADALSGVGEVICDPGQLTVNGSSVRCRATLAAGQNLLAIVVRDRAGNLGSAAIGVTLDQAGPVIELTAPLAGARTNAASAAVSGTVSDDDRVASLTVNGTAVPLNGVAFATTIALTEGSNAVTIAATDRAGNVTTRAAGVTRFVVPTIAIAAPADLVVVRSATVDVSGSVTGAVAVTVNGIPASVSGSTFNATGIALAQGRTVVTASATSATGSIATESILVYRDSIPPRVVLRYPLDGATLFQSPIDVAGMVDDIVVGTINSGQARITVNGANAEVSNRGFLALNVALAPGPNTLTIVATDQGGNAVTHTAHVTYVNAPGQAKIVAVSGSDQTGVIGTELPSPLVVRLLDTNGLPASGRTVSFEVAENNGLIAATGGAPARSVITTTNAQGEALVRWLLGTRAGAGNQRVAATAAGFAGVIDFSASASMGAARLLVVDSGNNQYGAKGAPLPRPLVAVAVDAGSNRVANAPVVFTVGDGGGSFNGQQTITVMTDSDGRAIATPSLGEATTNVFNASLPNNISVAAFVATGRVAGPPAETRISGVILDNTDIPIPNVTVRIDGTAITAQADAQGQFTINGAPVGYVKLLVDGSTALRPGTWPMLEYAMYTIPGANNRLEMPIYLLPIDVRRGLFVDEVTGGTLLLPEMPGFSLTVKPGSATFPGGSRTGTVSVTLVHADKMPMAPGFGQQPRFIVTIQPPGVHFDPPAAISFPNVDGLAAGEVTEMYSFDHDLGQFVSIGTASVSQNGTVLASDPGVGIIKGGWHCGGNPPPGATTHNCPECKDCINNVCQPRTGPLNDYRFACCKGVKHSTETQCCINSNLMPRVPFRGVAECPNYEPLQGWSYQYDGCSVPSSVLPSGVDGDNPAGGDQTSWVDPVNRFGPCDAHDRCYQTCNPNGQAACDLLLFADSLAVCDAAVADAPFTRAQCRVQAYIYYQVLSNAGFFVFNNRQKEVCLCC